MPHVLLTFGKVRNPLRLPTQNDISTSKRGPNPFVFYTFDLEMRFAPQWRAIFRHLNLQKWSGTVGRQFFTLLTWKCGSRHNGVHFFDLCTSKTVPNMVCFVDFDLELCFAPQRRALFPRLNFQKWFGTVSVFLF